MCDILVATVLLVTFLPVIGVLALLVRLSGPGPVLFVQERTGRYGQRFRMYKFRTMVADAELRKAEMMALNERSWPDFKISDDPRITRIGRFLRKTSLDELPQLLNVLRGDMSLVGPRPTSFPASTYEPWQMRRLDVPPGLTGLWQVAARNDTEFSDRCRIDITYIESRSMLLDLYLILATAGVVGTGR